MIRVSLVNDVSSFLDSAFSDRISDSCTLCPSTLPYLYAATFLLRKEIFHNCSSFTLKISSKKQPTCVQKQHAFFSRHIQFFHSDNFLPKCPHLPANLQIFGGCSFCGMVTSPLIFFFGRVQIINISKLIIFFYKYTNILFKQFFYYATTQTVTTISTRQILH